MLKNKRQNYHHSKLPNLGEIVVLPNLYLQADKRFEKWIVESFNLCDNVQPYSVGIHLVNLSLLSNRNVKKTVAGHWCEPAYL